MKQITFDDICILGKIVTENAQYKHYHYPEMLVRYDSNFIEFKSTPSITEFKEAESYLREFHLKQNQKHLKFYFPANIKPTVELIDLLTDRGYEIGFLELYTIDPKDFPSVKSNPEIDIQVVTDNNLAVLLKLQYQHDLSYGIDFAMQKADLIKRQFEDQYMQQVLAFYKGVPAGCVDVIISKDTAEIDNLTVDELFRNKGIGSRLQEFVMETFPNKIVILVADGEDTPREMYKKQNYHYHGFKYEAQKI